MMRNHLEYVEELARTEFRIFNWEYIKNNKYSFHPKVYVLIGTVFLSSALPGELGSEIPTGGR